VPHPHLQKNKVHWPVQVHALDSWTNNETLVIDLGDNDSKAAKLSRSRGNRYSPYTSCSTKIDKGFKIRAYQILVNIRDVPNYHASLNITFIII